jgi:hypothetical protein
MPISRILKFAESYLALRHRSDLFLGRIYYRNDLPKEIDLDFFNEE